MTARIRMLTAVLFLLAGVGQAYGATCTGVAQDNVEHKHDISGKNRTFRIGSRDFVTLWDGSLWQIWERNGSCDDDNDLVLAPTPVVNGVPEVISLSSIQSPGFDIYFDPTTNTLHGIACANPESERKYLRVDWNSTLNRFENKSETPLPWLPQRHNPCKIMSDHDDNLIVLFDDDANNIRINRSSDDGATWEATSDILQSGILSRDLKATLDIVRYTFNGDQEMQFIYGLADGDIYRKRIDTPSPGSKADYDIESNWTSELVYQSGEEPRSHAVILHAENHSDEVAIVYQTQTHFIQMLFWNGATWEGAVQMSSNKRRRHSASWDTLNDQIHAFVESNIAGGKSDIIHSAFDVATRSWGPEVVIIEDGTADMERPDPIRVTDDGSIFLVADNNSQDDRTVWNLVSAPGGPPPPPPPGTIVLVDFGASPPANIYELTGWNTATIDKYTDYAENTPIFGVKGGSNPNYMYARVSGSPHTFNPGDVVTVTWYNNSSSAITFTPYISFNDPDRRDRDTPGDWDAMDQITIGAGQSSSGTFTLTAAGSHSLVNINNNYGELDNDPSPADLVLDKIELDSVGSNPDTTPPSTPGNLVATAISTSEIDLVWDPATDPDSGVAQYLIYRDGTLHDTSPVAGYVDTGLSPATTYTYGVSAENGVGLESEKSNAVSATTDSAGGAVVLIDFVNPSSNNIYGLPGWDTEVTDQYTHYVSTGPGGVKGGTNPNYTFGLVTGPDYTFNVGDTIRITWYNNTSSSITFNPYISFDDPDRRTKGVSGTWTPLDPVTIGTNQSGTADFVITSGTVGEHPLVNVNTNYAEPINTDDTPHHLILDKIELIPN